VQSQSSKLREFALYFLRLGALGFGGPIALAGHMQRDLVEEKRWISKEDYVEGLALSQLAPGPLAAQLAIYLGWIHSGFIGATLVGVAFILPSFFIVLILSELYVRFGGLSWIQGLFYGVGAAVIAVIAQSANKLVKKTLEKDWLLWAIAGVSATITVATESEILWVFLLSGIISLFIKTPPKMLGLKVSLVPLWMVTGIHGEVGQKTFFDLAWFFVKAGSVVFGSGLAIVPFLHGGVVQEWHWLTERQFIDAVAVAMITPGPVVITVAFIGYLVGGLIGAIVAALGVFLPCFLVVVISAPYYRKFAQVPQIKAFVGGVTAAAVGAIGGSVVILGKRAINDLPTILIAGLTLFALLKIKKVPEPVLILLAGLVGLIVKGALHF
jgi:chromate transporter